MGRETDCVYKSYICMELRPQQKLYILHYYKGAKGRGQNCHPVAGKGISRMHETEWEGSWLDQNRSQTQRNVMVLFRTWV